MHQDFELLLCVDDQSVRVRGRITLEGTLDPQVLEILLGTALEGTASYASSRYGIPPQELGSRTGPLAEGAASTLAERLPDYGGRFESLEVFEASPAERSEAPPRKSAEEHFELGWMHAREGRWQPALLEFARAHALAPRHLDAWHNVGWALGNLERWAEAECVFLEIQRRHPDFSLATQNLAWVQRSQDR